VNKRRRKKAYKKWLQGRPLTQKEQRAFDKTYGRRLNVRLIKLARDIPAGINAAFTAMGKAMVQAGCAFERFGQRMQKRRDEAEGEHKDTQPGGDDKHGAAV
jgi:hypothetical protein